MNARTTRNTRSYWITRDQKPPFTRINYKLKQIIKSTSTTSDGLLSPELSSCEDGKENLIRDQIFRITVFVISLLIFSYQSYDRVSYYLSCPLAVDVSNERSDEKIPPLMVCNSNTEDMKQIWKTTTHVMDNGATFGCVNQLLDLSGKKIHYDLKTVWEASNVSKTMIDLDTKKLYGNTPLKINHVSTFFGTCATFYIDKSLPKLLHKSFSITYKSADICPEASYALGFLENDDIIDLRGLLNKFPHTSTKISVYPKKYMYKNSKHNPCVGKDVYQLCRFQCLLHKLRSRLTCRLPPIHPDVNITTCESSALARSQYVLSLRIVRETDIGNDCKCQRSCEEIFFSMIVDIEKIEENLVTKFTLQFNNDNVHLLRERFSYDFSFLIADLGGNMGLFLGLSALGLLEKLFLLGYKIRRQYNGSPDRLRVMKLRQKMVKVQKTMPRNCAKLQRGINIKIVRKILLCSVTLLCIYLLSVKYDYYSREPIRSIIEVSKTRLLQFPIITVCGEHVKIGLQRNKLFKKLGDLCRRVPAWAVVSEYFSVDKVWEFVNIDQYVDTESDPKKHSYGYEEKINYTRLLVPTPFGNCTQLITEPIISAGSTATLVFPLNLMPVVKQCQFVNLWHFSTVPGEPFVITKPNGVPYSFLSDMGYEIVKIKRKNTRHKPCEPNEKKHFRCKRYCIQDKLTINVTCSLPYMTSFNIRHCESASEAVKSHNQYIENLLVHSDRCSCKQRCDEMSYRTVIASEELPVSSFTVITHYFLNDLIETQVENFAYPLPKFISDTGSIIGLLLGLSLLSVCDFVIKITNLGVRAIFLKLINVTRGACVSK